MFFLLFLLPDLGGPKHIDSTHPDPQHWKNCTMVLPGGWNFCSEHKTFVCLFVYLLWVTRDFGMKAQLFYIWVLISGKLCCKSLLGHGNNADHKSFSSNLSVQIFCGLKKNILLFVLSFCSSVFPPCLAVSVNSRCNIYISQFAPYSLFFSLSLFL
jgi:hypothetical protein